MVAAAVAPDLDGLGIIPELLTRHSSHPLLWFSEYHHSLHTISFALICAIAAFLAAGASGRGLRFRATSGASRLDTSNLSLHPWVTAMVVFVSFHVHLLCDLVGARGPDGYQWPIPYLKPFSNAADFAWHGQWALNGWQNFAFTGLLLLVTFWFAWKNGASPLELVSGSANRAFVLTLRQRWPSND